MYKLRANKEKAVTYLIEAMEYASDENLLSYFVNDLNHTKGLFEEIYKTHLMNINLKLEVDNRTKAVAKAKEHGLI